MGVLDVILGRDENGNVSKINLALIALMLWKMYQSTQGRSTEEPVPTGRRADSPAQPRQETQQPTPIPSPSTRDESDGGFRDLTEAMNRMPDYRREPGSGGGMGGGLGDILGDILGGGRGRQPRPGGTGGGGLGDILGDILGGGRPGGMRAMGSGGAQGDPFGDVVRGGAGAGLGGLLSVGLRGLLQQFDESGHGDQARSWVDQTDNKPITAAEIEDTFGVDTIDTLVVQLGVPRDELLSGLAQVLPQAVDQMTPEGRLPTPDDMMRWR